jgi:hypothetical protein
MTVTHHQRAVPVLVPAYAVQTMTAGSGVNYCAVRGVLTVGRYFRRGERHGKYLDCHSYYAYRQRGCRPRRVARARTLVLKEKAGGGGKRWGWGGILFTGRAV